MLYKVITKVILLKSEVLTMSKHCPNQHSDYSLVFVR